MEKLLIEKTFQTPYVLLDPKSNTYEITGNSFPNNALRFYVPILDWFTRYFLNEKKEVRLQVHIHYQNSSSKKMFTEMMKLLDDFYKEGKAIQLDWNYYSDDEDMLLSGTHIQKEVSFPVHLVPKQPDPDKE
ncbi:MAG TPA: DUF1987 domain-containing protein [Bacteroidia bacterium]|jgi:hypothetical protein|nr:DUF1987 domain-containing protein [Bacteroidia bacterium]